MTDGECKGVEAAGCALSVVVLCYRSEERSGPFVRRLLETLEEAGVGDFQLVLVGNFMAGEPDETPRVVAELAAGQSRISCVALPKQGMMGWDVKRGLELARGEYVAIVDGDGQVDPRDVPRAYLEASAEGLDMVKGYRVIREDGLVRKLLSVGFTFLFNLIFPGVGSRDVNCKPKVLSRSALERMNLAADDWFIDAEMMIEASRLGLCWKEIPTVFGPLDWRPSFVSFGTVLEFLKNLAVYRWKASGAR